MFPIQEVVETLKKEEREQGKGRKWRAAFRRIQQQLIDLEGDSKALELVFPQVCPDLPKYDILRSQDVCFSVSDKRS